MAMNANKQKWNTLNTITKAMLSVFAVTPLYLVAEENNDEEIEVMQVTAQKRVQSILDVPVTLSAVNADTMEESSAISLSDIDKFIPGFDFDNGNVTQAGVSIRGISSPNISVGGDPSSATFYDDVYMPRAAQNVLFSDLSRVEVLKGPQGTLFGRNAAMGVVNVVPNSPNSEFEGFAKATFGSDNLHRFEGMLNLPLNENMYFRGNILSNKQDGFIENISRPDWSRGSKIWDPGAKNHTAARVAFKWDISDVTDFQLSYDWDDLNQAPPMAIGTSQYAYNKGKTPFADKVENDVKDGVESRDMYGITTKINHDFNDEWSMKYVASYRKWETENLADEDGTGDRTRYFDTNNKEDSDIFYTEIQFNYISDTINAVTGFSYSKENVKQVTDLNLTADTAARLITGGLNQFIKGKVAEKVAGKIGGNTDEAAKRVAGPDATFAGLVDREFKASGLAMEHFWNADEWARTLTALGFADQIMAGIGMPGKPLTADIVRATGDVTYNLVSQKLGNPAIFGPGNSGKFWRETIANTGDFTNWGVFADVDYAITDEWHVIAGVRYSRDSKDFTWDIGKNTFNAIKPGVPNLIFQPVNLAVSDSWNKVTGRLVTSYKLSDEHMMFASYSTGYKSGGFDSLKPTKEAFKPEETTNFEIGYKGVLWDQLVANVSVYYLQLENFQKAIDSKAPGNSQAIPTIINEDRDIKGLEFDLRWNVSETLVVGALSEIRTTKDTTPDFYNGEGKLVKATSMSKDAATDYTLLLDWMPDFGIGNTNVHLDYVFRENINDEEVGLEDYKKRVAGYFKDTQDLNARISWTNEADSLEVGLWVKNLMDNRVVEGLGGLAADALGTPFGRVNRGREIGIDLKFNF
ncbi:MAG: TonB-dependent receptor [Parashewanella sp.]